MQESQLPRVSFAWAAKWEGFWRGKRIAMLKAKFREAVDIVGLKYWSRSELERSLESCAKADRNKGRLDDPYVFRTETLDVNERRLNDGTNE